MGDGRAERSSAIGDGGQAAISLTPDLDGTHVLIIDDTVALDCILNVAATFVYRPTFRCSASKTNSASSNKENPLAISCVVNLFGSSVTSSSSCVSSSFLQASNSIMSALVSSSCCTAASADVLAFPTGSQELLDPPSPGLVQGLAAGSEEPEG